MGGLYRCFGVHTQRAQAEGIAYSYVLDRIKARGFATIELAAEKALSDLASGKEAPLDLSPRKRGFKNVLDNVKGKGPKGASKSQQQQQRGGGRGGGGTPPGGRKDVVQNRQQQQSERTSYPVDAAGGGGGPQRSALPPTTTTTSCPMQALAPAVSAPAAVTAAMAYPKPAKEESDEEEEGELPSE